MGIYLFKTEVLMDLLSRDDKPDFGKDILPDILRTHKVMAYPFRRENKIPDKVFYTDEHGERKAKLVESLRDSGYWRDVGTLDSYWNANMDLTGVDPYFNMYGVLWPIRTYQRQYPPAKTVFANDFGGHGAGQALDSLVSHGCIISGGTVVNSVLSYNVIVQNRARVEESVLMENVVVGPGAQIKKAIVAEGVRIPANARVGYNPQEEMGRLTVSPRGITVVTREDRFE